MIKKTILLILILTGISCYAGDGPGLGRPATTAEINSIDMGIMPDGEGLPGGSGNAKQGKQVYEKHCLRCHGENGLGDSGDQLAGAQMGLTSAWPEKTIGNYWPYATTVFDFTRRSMPMENPGSLSNDDVYAVTAYLLFLNGIITEDTVMNRDTLVNIRMPNRDGFINMYKGDN